MRSCLKLLLFVSIPIILLLSPSFASASASHVQYTVSVKELKAKSLSHLEVQDSDKTEILYLYAPDQQAELKDDSNQYCGAHSGQTELSGNYYLILTRGKQLLSSTALGQMSFTIGSSWDGTLEHFQIPGRGNNVVRLSQYATCESKEDIYLFAVAKGIIKPVTFVMRDKTQAKSIVAGDNTLDVSQDGKSLQACASWMGPEGWSLGCQTFRSSDKPEDDNLYEISSCKQGEGDTTCIPEK
jgi:hypothetical protein